MAVDFQKIFRITHCKLAVGCFVETVLYDLLHHVNYH